ncbi:hypothetical protein CapIbe_013487 [Capra ibex]
MRGRGGGRRSGLRQGLRSSPLSAARLPLSRQQVYEEGFDIRERTSVSENCRALALSVLFQKLGYLQWKTQGSHYRHHQDRCLRLLSLCVRKGCIRRRLGESLQFGSLLNLWFSKKEGLKALESCAYRPTCSDQCQDAGGDVRLPDWPHGAGTRAECI